MKLFSRNKEPKTEHKTEPKKQRACCSSFEIISLEDEEANKADKKA